MTASITCSDYGVTSDGRRVELYTLRNNNNVEVGVITYGGIITTFKVPDHNNVPVDIVLGYDTLAQYEACNIYMGCIIGRYANRIARGEFELDGKRFYLETNDGDNHLHGGNNGFHKTVWQATVAKPVSAQAGKSEAGETGSGADTPAALILGYTSGDGESGYPGSLSLSAEYTLNNSNELKICFKATTDKPTVVNLTNHCYFNLSGHQNAVSNGVLEHLLQLPGNRYIPTDNGVPLRQFQPVKGTPMDFTKSTAVGLRISDNYPQLLLAKGYDHTWVIERDGAPNGLRLAACLTDPASGRRMQVFTTQPGVQFYTANHVDNCLGKSHGGEEIYYGRHGSLCLETQHYPDSPNRAEFPSTVLRPGESLCETTIWQLSG